MCDPAENVIILQHIIIFIQLSLNAQRLLETF